VATKLVASRVILSSIVNYYSFMHYPSSCLLFKIQRLGDVTVSPSSGVACSVGLSR
jgi:hypothetical protein